VPEPHHPPQGYRRWTALGAAVAVTLPGIVLRLSGAHVHELVAAALFGLAVVGAAFMLAWAAEVIQLDVSAGLALALLALIAVLPEYAVDFVFTWKAGDDPEQYAPLALANMTGGNQLLIGVGWPLVVLLAAWRLRRLGQGGLPPPAGTPSAAVTDVLQGGDWHDVELERTNSIEIAFLTLASLYGLTLPFRSSITLVDAVILVAIYVGYLARTARLPATEPHLVGPALTIGQLPARQRRILTGAMFGFAALIILLCAEPFAEALVHTGEEFGVSTFLLVKWVAPLASEAPELLVAGLFAWRLRTSDALGALVSSKVNQWTLLVGTLPIVFAISSASLHGLPLAGQQQEELFVTAAQSVLAVAILASLSISVQEALVLLGLFVTQFVLSLAAPESMRTELRIGVGVVYLVLAVVVLLRDRRTMVTALGDGIRRPVSELAEG
jgi:cation:H+ antiporter